MRGTILVLTDKQTLDEDERYCPWTDYEMIPKIPGCDRVVADDEAGFQESLQCLNEAYGLDIQRTTVSVDSVQVEVGILDRECMKSLMQALRESKKERREKVRAELEKPDPDMWRVAYDAYMKSNSYIVVINGDDASFSNEMEFYHSMQNEPGPLYAVGTYRFHV
ncbi:MAG: hypothetical protein WAL98_07435 [Desulfatiglandaceae bacterium]